MTKPKDGKTKDSPVHILVCILLCITFLSLVGLALETTTIFDQKFQIAILENKNLKLRKELANIKLYWLKKQIQKLPKKKTPISPSI